MKKKPREPTRHELLGVLETLDTDGLDDALNALDALTGYKKERRLYAVWCARQVQHLMTDPYSLAALDVAERHAHGQASDEELKAVWGAADAAARAAARAARAASSAAWGAVSAAWSAARAASAAARRAASAATSAAWSAAAGDAPWDAASDAARAAADVAARNAQAAKLCETIEVSLCRQDKNS